MPSDQKAKFKKNVWVYFCILPWSLLAASSLCFAEVPQLYSDTFPSELRTEEILPNLDAENLSLFACVNRQCFHEAHSINQMRWKRKVAKLERLFGKYGGFTKLSENKEIANFPFTQEIVVEILGNNPSVFSKVAYCFDTYMEVKIAEETISMCPDLPSDSIIAVNKGRKNSDEEIYAELNRIYKNAGLVKENIFGRATFEEWNYADTEDGTNPKLSEHSNLSQDDSKFLGKFTPYLLFSDVFPRSVFKNAPNAWGFRRAGNLEWVEDMKGWYRLVVGGSWYHLPNKAISGSWSMKSPFTPHSYIGASRMVRTRIGSSNP
jgi:hypothetical protein